MDGAVVIAVFFFTDIDGSMSFCIYQHSYQGGKPPRLAAQPEILTIGDGK